MTGIAAKIAIEGLGNGLRPPNEVVVSLGTLLSKLSTTNDPTIIEGIIIQLQNLPIKNNNDKNNREKQTIAKAIACAKEKINTPIMGSQINNQVQSLISELRNPEKYDQGKLHSAVQKANDTVFGPNGLVNDATNSLMQTPNPQLCSFSKALQECSAALEGKNSNLFQISEKLNAVKREAVQGSDVSAVSEFESQLEKLGQALESASAFLQKIELAAVNPLLSTWHAKTKQQIALLAEHLQHRQMTAITTVEQDLAIIKTGIYNLAHATNTNEPLPDIPQLDRQKLARQLHTVHQILEEEIKNQSGMVRKLITDITDVMQEEGTKALQGLKNEVKAVITQSLQTIHHTGEQYGVSHLLEKPLAQITDRISSAAPHTHIPPLKRLIDGCSKLTLEKSELERILLELGDGLVEACQQQIPNGENIAYYLLQVLDTVARRLDPNVAALAPADPLAALKAIFTKQNPTVEGIIQSNREIQREIEKAQTPPSEPVTDYFEENQRLITNMKKVVSFEATITTLYEKFCGCKDQSDESTVMTILQNVRLIGDLSSDESKDTFINQLTLHIDQKKDVNFIKKTIAKLLIRPVLFFIHYFSSKAIDSVMKETRSIFHAIENKEQLKVPLDVLGMFENVLGKYQNICRNFAEIDTGQVESNLNRKSFFRSAWKKPENNGIVLKDKEPIQAISEEKLYRRFANNAIDQFFPKINFTNAMKKFLLTPAKFFWNHITKNSANIIVKTLCLLGLIGVGTVQLPFVIPFYLLFLGVEKSLNFILRKITKSQIGSHEVLNSQIEQVFVKMYDSESSNSPYFVNCILRDQLKVVYSQIRDNPISTFASLQEPETTKRAIQAVIERMLPIVHTADAATSDAMKVALGTLENPFAQLGIKLGQRQVLPKVVNTMVESVLSCYLMLQKEDQGEKYIHLTLDSFLHSKFTPARPITKEEAADAEREVIQCLDDILKLTIHRVTQETLAPFNVNEKALINGCVEKVKTSFEELEKAIQETDEKPPFTENKLIDQLTYVTQFLSKVNALLAESQSANLGERAKDLLAKALAPSLEHCRQLEQAIEQYLTEVRLSDARLSVLEKQQIELGYMCSIQEQLRIQDIHTILTNWDKLSDQLQLLRALDSTEHEDRIDALKKLWQEVDPLRQDYVDTEKALQYLQENGQARIPVSEIQKRAPKSLKSTFDNSQTKDKIKTILTEHQNRVKEKIQQIISQNAIPDMPQGSQTLEAIGQKIEKIKQHIQKEHADFSARKRAVIARFAQEIEQCKLPDLPLAIRAAVDPQTEELEGQIFKIAKTQSEKLRKLVSGDPNLLLGFIHYAMIYFIQWSEKQPK